MSNFYDDSKFGVIERYWTGLTSKHGGADDVGFGLGTTDATTIDHLARYYPKGPIRMLKAGHFVLATIGGGGTDMDVIPARILVDGANESGDWNIPDAGAPFSIASTVTFTDAVVDAGSYIGVRTGTPQSTNATAANTATVTGTVAFFVDYRRVWVETGKWDT